LLCAGITVLDEVFLVDSFPAPDGKTQAKNFFVVNGGCAANAAVAIARLGGHVALAGPLGGPAGEDSNGDRVLAALARENVDCSACQRISGMSTALSAIFIDAHGDRMIVTYRDERIATAKPADPEGLVAAVDVLLADNRYPDFVRPICAAARRRGIPVILDGDRPTVENDPLFREATHVVFSSECLRATTGVRDLGDGLKRIAAHTDAFLAASDGPNAIVFLEGEKLHAVPVFAIPAVDTLGAGDALHGGFALAIAEGRSEAEALRFGAAVAALKCTRLGGSTGTPTRAEVEAFLAERG
jgi:sugar/nucleoside kinase (ribokinase family)